MRNNLKKVTLVAMILVTVFAAGYLILDACSATSSCGAWCSTWGCGGDEYCRATASGVYCECGGSKAAFLCDGRSVVKP